MYKKRFTKWGFKKNSKQTAASRRSSMTRECKSAPNEKANSIEDLGFMPAVPKLSHRDGLALMFLTSVQTWSFAFFESLQLASYHMRFPASQLGHSSTKELGFAFRLVVQLLSQGRGDLAGRVARKAFLQIEDMLTVEGPALVWNLLDIMHYTVMVRHAKLFHILLDYLIPLANSRMIGTHPLPTMLRGLRKLVGSMSVFDPSLLSSDIPSLLRRAWTINAEIVFNHFDTRLFGLYCHVLWDSCSIGPPVALMASQIEAQQTPSTAMVAQTPEELLGGTSNAEDSMFHGLLEPRMDASLPRDYDMLRASSIAALRERGNFITEKLPSFSGDTTLLMPMLAGLAIAKVLENSPDLVVSRLHVGGVACAIRTLIDLDLQHAEDGFGAISDAVQQARALVALRTYAESETHPQVIQDMWLLRDALFAAGKYGEAQEVEQDAYQRVEKYLQDISSDST